MNIRHVKPHLKKELTLFDSVVYGVGLIIGAGIFSLIGKGAGIAGNSLWLSFVIGGAIALFSGLSYAELSSAFSRDAVEYNYVKHATKNRMMAFVVGLLTVFAGTAATATVAVGFSGYLKELLGIPLIVSSTLIIALSAIIVFFGVRISTKLIFLLTLLQIAGLLFIIGMGGAHISAFGPVDYFDFSGGFEGVLLATTLVFFAFIGFEGIANMSEEVKNAKKTVPIAMIVAILITTAVYILIAVSAVSIVDYRQLSESDAPMSLVAETAASEFGLSFPASAAISIIALLSTASTVIINTMVISRILYGLRFEPSLPTSIGTIHPKTNVPHISVVTVAGAAIIMAALGDISMLASMANFAVFLTFFSVNVSLIILRMDPSFKPGFRLPLSIGKVPVTAVMGAIWCAFILSTFEAAPIKYGSILILAEILLFMQANKAR